MSNGRNKRILELDLADIPLVAHALSIEHCTYIGVDKAKCLRAKELFDLVDQMVPPIARIFDETDWQDFCRRINAGAAYEIAHERKGIRWDSSEGEIVVRIDGREWRTDRAIYLDDAPEIDQLRSFLEEYAPLPSSSPRP